MPNTSNKYMIDYYDLHADMYFNATVDTDMSECCERFLKYLTPGDSIIDIGAGSGRDIRYFLNHGYKVDGMDASSELCKIASKYTGVAIQCQTIQEWRPERRYNGIWANASLLHLTIGEIQEFIYKIPSALYDGGVVYISLKSGIATGTDADGRFFTNITEQEVQHLIGKSTAISVVEMWKTEDKLKREGFCWINIILRKP
jgi:cyclopropane fatty-acyl-phospholipid synthase-like methyltransferase